MLPISAEAMASNKVKGGDPTWIMSAYGSVGTRVQNMTHSLLLQQLAFLGSGPGKLTIKNHLVSPFSASHDIRAFMGIIL